METLDSEHSDGGTQNESQASDEHVDEVGKELERVLGSRIFRRTNRLKLLLSYIVNVAVKGKSTDERRTARELFGKDGDFSPTRNPIVRVHLGRLRKSLAVYYDSEGRLDPVVIEIPSRSYTATFHFRCYGQN